MIKKRIFTMVFLGLFSVLSYFFYINYVPLLKPFQAALVPLLVFIFTLSALNIRWGILGFFFFVPLINSMPYFFGIDLSIPHAPTALLLFFALFLGWLVYRTINPEPVKLDFPILKPMALFGGVILVSTLITFFRYANFYPFKADDIYELVVNVSGVRAGGALMSTVFSGLNYMTGLLLFFILINVFKSGKYIKKVLFVLSLSFLIAMIFGIIQRYFSIGLGNTTFWIWLNRINGTFKDPNAFGFYVAVLFPLTLGFFLDFFKNPKMRIYLSILILVELFVFSFIGSRSGLLGLGASMIVFGFIIIRKSHLNSKRKKWLSFSVILLVISFAVLFYLIFPGSNLAQRLDTSYKAITPQGNLSDLFTMKLDMWRVALRAFIDSPLSGVGIGAYIVELPNYFKEMDFNNLFSDSAENYIFQAGAELGLAGLVLLGWLLYEIMKVLWDKWKKFKSGAMIDKNIQAGVICAFVAMGINYMFHSYIGSFEVKYLFWLIIAVLICFSSPDQNERKNKKSRRNYGAAAVVLIVIFAAGHLWISAHSFRIEQRRIRFGWAQDFGFYQIEHDENVNLFRWTEKMAGIVERNTGVDLKIPLRASHPDLRKNPVRLKIYSSNQYFQKVELIEEVTFHNTRWTDFIYKVSANVGERIYLLFEAGRTWQPYKALGIPDYRKLGVAVGLTQYMYPQSLEGMTLYNKVNSWEGDQKDKLWTNGTSWITFEAVQDNPTLRLHLNGQRALNIGPYIIIRIDGKLIGRNYLQKTEWSVLVFTPKLKAGKHTLSVEFTNDYYDKNTGADRNIQLGDLEVLYER